MMRPAMLIGFSLALLAGPGTALYAQARDTAGGRSGMPDMMMPDMMEMMKACPMAAAMEQGPEAALEHADALGLTDEQRRRLTELKRAAQDARDVLTAKQRAKLGELRRDRAMQRMERMMRMMNMMMGMMDMMGEMSDSGMGMDQMHGRR